MKQVFSAIMLIVISLILTPAVSDGAVREGSIEISPFFGYCTGSTSRDLCHKDVYGLRVGYVLTPNWELEGAIEGVGNDAAVMYHADALYHFMPEKSFHPFIIAGVGGAHVRPMKGDSYNTMMADIGVGFKYQLSETLAFRTEIRDVMTHSQNSVVSAGLTFIIGKKTPKSAVEAQAVASVIQPAPEKKVEPEPVPASAPEPVAQPARPEPVKVVLEDVHFEFGKSALTKAAKKMLDEHIKTIKAKPDVQIQIQGHACAHGSEKLNMQLSRKRANAVKAYLIQHGVKEKRLTVAAYGETKLAMPEVPTKANKYSKEAEANRRVRFEVNVK